MKSCLRLMLAIVCLLFSVGAAVAVQVPLSIAPDPVNFPSVPINTTSYAVPVFITNISSGTVDITGMTLSGTDSSQFAFDGPTCTLLLAGGQTCQMEMTFTPTILGNVSANMLVAYAGSGSPLTIPLVGIGETASPVITSLSPASVYVGSPAVTLVVKGTGFIPGSAVYWNYNTTLITTYNSSTQLTAVIPASYLTNTYNNSVFVSNSINGNQNSNYETFNVVALDPSISYLSPISVIAGNGGTSIEVQGNNFMDGASVLWNGKRMPTSYVSSSELTINLTAKQLAKPEIVQVSVSNPAPGGISAVSNFNVTYPALVRTLNLPANDVIWDPSAQKIYASLPSSFGSNGNSIAVVDPFNGSVSAYYFAGSEPTQMALSADSKYLYVGLNGNGSVQRFILPNFTPDINVSLGASSYGGLNVAGAMQVSPTDSHTFAVALGTAGCCSYGGTLEFFKDTTLLPDSIIYPTVSSIQFVSGTLLYGYAESTLIQVAVNSQGGTLTTQFDNVLTSYGNIQYDAGLIYDNSGQVMNPSTGLLVGSYDVGNSYSGVPYVLAESAINKLFAVGTTPFFSSLGITSYSLDRFTPEAVINLAQVSGSLSPIFLNWGTNGLAFIIGTGCCGTESYQLVLVQSSMMEASSPKR